MTAELRVLHLTSSFPRTADDHVAPFLLDLVRAQTAAGITTRVLAPHDAGAPVTESIEGISVRRFRYAPDRAETLGYRGGLQSRIRTPAALFLPAFLAAFTATAAREVATWRPHVVHAHWWLPAGLCALPGAGLGGCPLVVTLHGSDAHLLTRPVLGVVGRLVLRRAALVTVVSADLRARVAAAVELPPGRLVELPLPVVTGPGGPRPLPPSPPVRLLAAGRLSPEKGFDLLLRALSLAVAGGLDATLTLVGSGPERERLAALARPIGERVRFVPAVPRAQLWGFMDEAHAVVVPSRREGLGLVAAEALARGRPVVASRTGGLPELLAAPGAGLLVLPDDVAALATALCRLPLPAPEPAAIGRRAPATVGADHRAAYEAVLHRQPVPARSVINR